MENPFSLRRIFLLIRANLHTKWKLYLSGYWVIFLLLLLILFMNDKNIESIPLLSYAILLVAVILQTAGFYPSWNRYGSSFFYLNLPARVSEKYVVLLTMTLLLFVPITILIITGSMYLISWLIHGGLGIEALNHQLIVFLSGEKLQTLGLTLLLFQSVYLYSTVSFNKNSFAFGTMIMVVTILFTATLPFFLLLRAGELEIWTSPIFFAYSIGRFFSHEPSLSNSLFRFTDAFRWADQLVWLFTSIGLITAAYFKLKEKEV